MKMEILNLIMLNLSNQNQLMRLLCDHNQLNTLDVSFDTNLTYINCNYNMISDFRTIGCDNLRMVSNHWNL